MVAPNYAQQRSRLAKEIETEMAEAKAEAHETGKPARIRRWVLYPTSKTTFAGTLTDAATPIKGDLSGNRLHLKYRMKDGLAFEQWMYLQPDRKTVLNHMTVRRWGIVVAHINETTRKLP